MYMAYQNTFRRNVCTQIIFLMFTQFNYDFICSLQYSVCFKIDFRETTFNNVISLDCMIFSFQCIARHENPSSVMKSD